MSLQSLHLASVPNEWQPVDDIVFQRHNHGLIARIDGCDDRNEAETRHNLELAVPRIALPEPEQDEFYWADLIDLKVLNGDDVEIGRIKNIFDNGASAVLDVSGKRGRYLIPFVKPVLQTVQLPTHVSVDWDESWTA